MKTWSCLGPRRLLAALAAVVFSIPAQAVPRRLILLRHGEKANDYALCGLGQERSLAVRDTYLGRGASDPSLFNGQTPAAFFAVTLHTVELAAPSAASWGMPLINYAVVPMDGRDAQLQDEMNAATKLAAADLLNNPVWHDRTVVVVWEHLNIASTRLERQNPGVPVTLRQLLNLDRLSGVPAKWEGSNYDFFWVVDFDPANSPRPTGFQMVKQTYGAPFKNLPENDWGTPLPADYPSSCLR